MSPSPAISFEVSTMMTRLFNSVESAKHRPAHAASQTDNHFPPVSDRRDAVQRALYPRPVVLRKGAHAMDHVIEVLSRNGLIAEINGSARKAAFGLAAEVHDNFN